ncbi:MAG: hypothetical protein ACTSQF_16115 [Candidatus Heimdallarchaeaceae archaeon]
MAEPNQNRKLKILIGFCSFFNILGILAFALYTILEPFIAEILTILHRNTIYAHYIIIGTGGGSLFIGVVIGIFAFREWRKKKRTVYDTFA